MKAGLLWLGLGVLASGCNLTSRMEIPRVSQTGALQLENSQSALPSFALEGVVANIRRGTPIAHFPMNGVPGTEGTFCNARHRNNSVIEWSAGSSYLGNWSTELGEVFYRATRATGLNVVGDPARLFQRSKAAQSAEYLLGARITKILGNFCEAHHWWDGRPQDRFSGEMYVEVEWTVFSSLQQREILRLPTRGYYKQVQSKRDGIILAFHEAFAHAAEGMLADSRFVRIASGKSASTKAPVKPASMSFVGKKVSDRPLARGIGQVLPAVVTVRLGASHGSGFAISEDGLILTNEHVVGQSERVSVVLNNGLLAEGRVVARSALRDVALVRVALRFPSFLPLRLDAPKPTERVYVVGTPLQEGLQSTVTSGVVSAIRADPRTGLSFIQSDASISPGNSGGPLLDAYGNVLGISVASIVGQHAQALNLFVPIAEALEVLNLKPASPGS